MPYRKTHDFKRKGTRLAQQKIRTYVHMPTPEKMETAECERVRKCLNARAIYF